MNTIAARSTPTSASSSVGLSVLKSANKQPELALELLMKTLAGGVSSLPTAGGPIPSSGAIQGQYINTTA
jgi:hypothetical protein